MEAADDECKSSEEHMSEDNGASFTLLVSALDGCALLSYLFTSVGILLSFSASNDDDSWCVSFVTSDGSFFPDTNFISSVTPSGPFLCKYKGSLFKCWLPGIVCGLFMMTFEYNRVANANPNVKDRIAF